MFTLAPQPVQEKIIERVPRRMLELKEKVFSEHWGHATEIISGSTVVLVVVCGSGIRPPIKSIFEKKWLWRTEYILSAVTSVYYCSAFFEIVNGNCKKTENYE